LTNLKNESKNLNKNVKFCFADIEKRAFEQLSEALSKKPIFKIYNIEIELHIDASTQGYTTILLQRDDEDRSLYPVYYASGKTTAAE